jgi:AcrR family transcriptional regulator
MPKVTDEHRASRREQITSAALACFARKGFQRTSMADIVAESGLSPGAIYLHFASKQEIALEVGRQVLSRRLGELDRLGEDGLDPIDAMRVLLGAMVGDLVDTKVLVQLWGEATADPEIDVLVQEIFGELGEAWTRYLTGWGGRHGVADPVAWARQRVPAVLALAQGFFVQRALLTDFDPDAYFASIRAATGADLLAPTRA